MHRNVFKGREKEKEGRKEGGRMEDTTGYNTSWSQSGIYIPSRCPLEQAGASQKTAVLA